MKKLRAILAATLLGSSLMVVTAGPATASSCFNPNDPVCMIAKAACDATDPAAKYRDRIASCYP